MVYFKKTVKSPVDLFLRGSGEERAERCSGHVRLQGSSYQSIPGSRAPGCGHRSAVFGLQVLHPLRHSTRSSLFVLLSCVFPLITPFVSYSYSDSPFNNELMPCCGLTVIAFMIFVF